MVNRRKTIEDVLSFGVDPGERLQRHLQMHVWAVRKGGNGRSVTHTPLIPHDSRINSRSPLWLMHSLLILYYYHTKFSLDIKSHSFTIHNDQLNIRTHNLGPMNVACKNDGSNSKKSYGARRGG